MTGLIELMMVNDDQSKFIKGILAVAVVFTIASILTGVLSDIFRLYDLVVTILTTTLIFLLYLAALTALLAMTYIFIKNHDTILGIKKEDKNG